MRKLLLAAALAALAVVAVPALAATNWSASLNAAQEEPRNSSRGTGSATFRIADNSRLIRYRIAARRLTGRVQAAHIHLGRPGVSGPVLVTICARPCTLPKSGTLTARQFSKAPGIPTFARAIRFIKQGRTYVNLHTSRFPKGEIRGQIRRAR
jgi:hypothetical protein